MADCIFCKIIGGAARAEVVYETEFALAFLDIHPSSRGHTLVIPKFHAETIDRLPDDHVGPLFLAVKTVMGLLETSLKPAGLNAGWNHGWAAGQRVNHLHVHLIPRYAGDGGAGIQFVVHGSAREDLAGIASQIRTCAVLYKKG
jgi:histidine triad (HIT) family protein